MSKKNYRPIERKPSHPGEILKSGFIDEYDLRIETVAKLLGIARGHLSYILNGHRPVTPDIAIRLEALTHTPASQWLALQSEYDKYELSKNQNFKQYIKSLDEWSAKALAMPKKERRNNRTTLALLEKTAVFAKHL